MRQLSIMTRALSRCHSSILIPDIRRAGSANGQKRPRGTISSPSARACHRSLAQEFRLSPSERIISFHLRELPGFQQTLVREPLLRANRSNAYRILRLTRNVQMRGFAKSSNAFQLFASRRRGASKGQINPSRFNLPMMETLLAKPQRALIPAPRAGVRNGCGMNKTSLPALRAIFFGVRIDVQRGGSRMPDTRSRSCPVYRKAVITVFGARRCSIIDNTKLSAARQTFNDTRGNAMRNDLVSERVSRDRAP